jgi:hypothetical protein
MNGIPMFNPADEATEDAILTANISRLTAEYPKALAWSGEQNWEAVEWSANERQQNIEWMRKHA